MRLLALLVVAFAVPALAASPSAQLAERKAAAAACSKASNLRNATVWKRTVTFSDTVGVDAMIVTGNWRPRHMKGAKATMLCLYNRADKSAEVQEAAGWSVGAK